MATAHGTPSRQQPHAVSAAASGNSDGDVWIELFGTVKSLEEAVDLCMQAFGPDPVDKVSRQSWEGNAVMSLCIVPPPHAHNREEVPYSLLWCLACAIFTAGHFHAHSKCRPPRRSACSLSQCRASNRAKATYRCGDWAVSLGDHTCWQLGRCLRTMLKNL